jgi:hypothetical protein
MSAFIPTTTKMTFSLELTQLVVQEPESEPISTAVDEGLSAIARCDCEVCVRTLIRTCFSAMAFDRSQRKTSFPSSKVNISWVSYKAYMQM